MSLRTRLARWLAGPAPDDDFWYQPLSAGTHVTPMTAMQHTAVAACVRIISSTTSSLPAITYMRRPDGGKDRATDYFLHRLVRLRPNPIQTAVEFWRLATRHLLLRGRFYAYTNPIGGKPTQLMPMHPDCVEVRRLPDGRPMFRYTDPISREAVDFGDGEVWYLRDGGDDPLGAASPIEQHRRSISAAITADDYAERFLQNDARPPLVLETEKVFKDEPTRQAFRRSVQEAQTGSNRGKIMVLEAGLKAKPIGLSNVDSQFLETRRYQVADIARIYGVPLMLLQETEKSTSWGTGLEQFNRMFLEHTIRPWLSLIESSILVNLIPEADQETYFVEFMADALNRGQTKERFEAYKIAIDGRFMVPNEARALENLNPLPGGDELAQPAAPPAAPPQDDDSEARLARAEDDLRRMSQRIEQAGKAAAAAAAKVEGLATALAAR